MTALVGVRHRFDDDLTIQVGLDFSDGQTEDTTGTRDDTVFGVPVDVVWDTTDTRLDPARGIAPRPRWSRSPIWARAAPGQ